MARSEVHVLGPDDMAANKLPALRAGDVLELAAGIHVATLLLNDLAGSEAAPITIRGCPGAVLRPAGRDGILLQSVRFVRIETLQIEGARRAGILVSESSDVTIRNCTLVSNGLWGVQTILSRRIGVEDSEIAYGRDQHGIYFSTTDEPWVRNCRIHHNAGCGIHLNGDVSEGGDGLISDALIQDNVLFENGKKGGAAINLDGADHAVVRNNRCYNNYSGGIAIFRGDAGSSGTGQLMASNTVYFRPGEGRYGIQILGAREVVMDRNILICGRGPALETDEAGLHGLQSSRNAVFRFGKDPQPFVIGETPLTLDQWRSRTRQDQTSILAAPAFCDLTASDFTTQPSSPAAVLGAGWRTANAGDGAGADE